MSGVVITGMGAVSACGLGAEALWRACEDGKSGVGTRDFPEIPRQKVRRMAAIPPELATQITQGQQARFQDPTAMAALYAAREAVAAAGLGADDFGSQCGVIIGSGFGGGATLDRNYLAFGADHAARLDAMSIPKIMANAAASWVSMEFGATGPVSCISTACASASQSIGLAAQLIRSGAISRCLAGGSEACLVAGTFRAWEMLRVMTPDLCRPFSEDRNGMVLGEGAGILIVESRDSAEARGAPILAELAGYGSSGDAGDLLRPNPAGAARSMAAALQDAGMTADEVGYVNTHGTGTIANDLAEVTAMRQVFGARLPEFSSTKPVHGHALGAGGALEAIVTIGALSNGVAPPNINFTAEDPAIGATPVLANGHGFVGAAMSNSFAFGGINASLVFRGAGA